MLRAALSGEGGAALVVLVVALGALAEWLARAGQKQHALAYSLGSAVVALASQALVTWHWVDEPGRAAAVSAIFGIGLLALNARWRQPVLSILGVALLVFATAYVLCWQERVFVDLWAAVLAGEALLFSGIAGLLSRRSPAPDEPESWLMKVYGRPLSFLACLAGLAALLLAGLATVLQPTGLTTVAIAMLTAAAFVSAGTYRNRWLTWVGSTLLLGCLAHALVFHSTDLTLPHPWAAALLLHATVTLLGDLALRNCRRITSPIYRFAFAASSQRETINREPEPRTSSAIAVFAEPLAQSALVSSIVAMPLLTLPAFVGEIHMLALALDMTWLAAVWLVIACTERWPGLFTAFQAALSVAVLYAVTAWLQGQGVVQRYPADLFTPRSLQAYGVGLAGLGLLWVLARIAARSHAGAAVLLEPEWPALDRVVLGGLVIGQAILAVWGVWPGMVRELTPASIRVKLTWIPTQSDAWGPGAWILLGALAVVLVAALWERYQTGAVLGLLVLALTVPVLAAGPFGAEVATASALRWGLAGCFVVCSVPVWLRDRGSLLARGLRIPLDPGLPLAMMARALLLGGAAVPVLLLTASVAALGFSGVTPAGPAAGSFFAHIGWVAATVTPMALVSLGLVGHAVRERSPGYAFAAGLVANVTLMGGYALQVVSGGRLDAVEWVRVLQIGSIGAAAWAIGWLVTRPWVAAWRPGPDSPLARPLMSLQLGMAAAGNALLLGVAVWLLVFPTGRVAMWTTEAGSVVGWLALGSVIAAVLFRNWDRRSLLSVDILGWLGLLLMGLAACSVERAWPGWGYRALMVGWAAYALAWALLGAARPTLSDTAAAIVGTAGLLAVFLGLKAAVVHQDQLWAAGAIALASPAGALLAVQRRNEGWAFTAGLGINLAASLVVWHIHAAAGLTGWWAHLVQANAIASAVGALLWLTMRRHIYGRPELSLSSGPLLAAQGTLGLLANGLLLGLPLVLLAVYPPLAPDLAQVGEAGGWLALILAFAAALWFADQVLPRNRVHILVLFGLALGVLAACALGPLDPGNWLSFHALTVTWCLTGLLTLAAGWVGTAFQLASSTEGSDERRAVLDRIAEWLPADLIPRWVSAIGLLIVALALRGIDDPQRPYWSAGATLVVSVLFGGLALWACRPRYVYASGLLLNLVGMLIWLARGLHTPAGFLAINVLCLAIASGFWSAVELALRHGELRLDLRGRSLPFCHLAAVLALVLLGGLVAIAVMPGTDPAAIAWTWTALAMTAVALTVTLWDADAGFTLVGLYTLGLLTIGLALFGSGRAALGAGLPTPPPRGPQVSQFLTLGIVLAAYVLATAALRWDAPRRGQLWDALALPRREKGWSLEWFTRTQVLVAAVVVALSLWMALGFETIGERLAGAVCVCLLLPAGVLLTASEAEAEALASEPLRLRVGLVTGLRHSTLALSVLAVAEVGWALLDPADPVRWLYRSVVLMVALAFMTPVIGIGLRRLLPADNLWAEAGRYLGPRLGMLATLVLAVVLVQEGVSFDPLLKRTPMALPAILVVVAALGMLMTASIAFAVVPGRDPLGLSERGRMLYVYACEVLLVFLFLHLKLTRPEMFGKLGTKYWTFLVMAIAFAGVGLGEFFARRGLRVLAEPLQRTGIFLPLLPLLAFWTKRVAPAAFIDSVARQAPGMRPLLDYIDPRLATIGFDQYALLWLLVAALFAFVATIQRSPRYGLVAALAANFGWWSLLVSYHDMGLAFLVHPQLWLIPLALIALAAGHLNRDRLTAAQHAALRYLALLTIYLSSTADLFIAGVGESAVLPLALAVLAVAGVLGGILLRVRAFLFLGVTFLFLDVFAMIWHAAVGRQQYWLWWVCGILLGGGIIALFALFEKRRNEVLRVVEELKSWK
jgi:hypothetical protein